VRSGCCVRLLPVRRPRAFVPALLGLFALLIAGAAGGCGRGRPVPATLAPAWREVVLPQVEGRIQLGDVTTCAGRWYAAGAVLPIGAGASTPAHRAGEPGGGADPGRPAIWSSMDGLTWTALEPRAVTAYGPFNRLYSVACGAGHLVAIGAVAGGAHGNQRISTWVADLAGRTLSEVDAPYDRYIGPEAVGVNQVSGGSGGFLIAGNRAPAGGLPGAAVWTSPDGAQFTLLDKDPALRSDAEVQTTAAAGTAVGGGWLLAGSLQRRGSGVARDPAAWSSPDGTHWTREEVPASAGDDPLQAVIGWPRDAQPDSTSGTAPPAPASSPQQGSPGREGPAGPAGAALAVGTRDGRFGAWLRSGDASGTPRWRTGGEFDTIGGSALPMPTAMAATNRSAFVAVCNGAEYRLWATADGGRWREVRVPARMAAGPQRRMVVAANGDRLLVAADDGERTRIWLATAPTA
jgi:hypothetical protein